jgi:hypothetical protein
MRDIEKAARRFVREHPDLVPVLRAMVDLARDNEARPESRLGEFCRSWLAAREPSTPRTLRVFADADLIQKVAKGNGERPDLLQTRRPWRDRAGPHGSNSLPPGITIRGDEASILSIPRHVYATTKPLCCLILRFPDRVSCGSAITGAGWSQGGCGHSSHRPRQLILGLDRAHQCACSAGGPLPAGGGTALRRGEPRCGKDLDEFELCARDRLRAVLGWTALRSQEGTREILVDGRPSARPADSTSSRVVEPARRGVHISAIMLRRHENPVSRQPRTSTVMLIPPAPP